MNSRTRTLKLLAVGPRPPPVNGMSQAFDILVRGLPTHGWDVDVVDLADRTERQGRAFTALRARDAGLSVARVLLQLRGKDLFYLTVSQSRWGFAKDALMLTAAHRAKIPTVVHLHGGHFRTFYESEPSPVQTVIERALEPVSGFIVLGDRLTSEFAMIAGAEHRTAVVVNPSDQPVASPKEAPRGKLRVLFLSNLHVQKGYLDVLSAGPLLARALPGWQIELHFAGAFQPGEGFTDTTTMESDFRRRAHAAQPAQVIWHGVVRGEEKRKLFEQSDVFALPTYYVNEGQPIAVLEALCAGLPVVATRYRGIPEVLPAEHHAYFVPPRDAEALSTSLARLADASEYTRASQAAIRASAQFSPSAHVERMSAVLKSFL